MSLPYEEYGIIGRPPTMLMKEAGLREWAARKLYYPTAHWLKWHGRMVDPRAYQGRWATRPQYFGKAREQVRLGWKAHSPAWLIREGKRMAGKGALTADKLAKSKKFLELQKTNPSLASKIQGAVQGATKGHQSWAYKGGPREWLMQPTGTFREAWRGGRVIAPGEAQVGAIRRFGRGVKGVAEEASRRGWTGASGPTKYIPWGAKGITAGFAGYGLHEAARGKLQPGESRAGKAGGEAGSTLAYIAGMPFGLPGIIGSSLLMGYGGQKAGEGIGRLVGARRAPREPVPTQQPQQPQQPTRLQRLTPAQRRILYQAGRATAQQRVL